MHNPENMMLLMMVGIRNLRAGRGGDHTLLIGRCAGAFNDGVVNARIKV